MDDFVASRRKIEPVDAEEFESHAEKQGPAKQSQLSLSQIELDEQPLFGQLAPRP